VLAFSLVVSPASSTRADEKADAAAAALLAEAKKAFNEKQFTPARDKFNQFIKASPTHKDVSAARLGLALVILEGPRAGGPNGMDRDYPTAIDLLKPLVSDAAFADGAIALYYLAYAQRETGLWQLRQISVKPAEAAALRDAAAQQLAAAGKLFESAVAAFVERAKASPAQPAGDLPADYDWAARARCDVADLLIRAGKPREAIVIAQPFIGDPILVRSQSRDLGRYLHGYAAYVAGDHAIAVRSLTMLAPFKDAELGTQTRYLLARIHHLAEERPEAAALYDSLLADYEAMVASARGIIADGNALKDNPRERGRLESLVRDPAPDHVEKAAFYYASLLLDQNQSAASAERFVKFAQQFPKSPLAPEAQLRLGLAQARLKQFPEAIKTLTPLQDHPVLGYEARWSLGRSIAQVFDPNNAQQKQQALTSAAAQFLAAADRAGKLNDPAAKLDRADILMDLADTFLTSGMAKEAAAAYQQVIGEKAEAGRVEQASQRRVAALHLAGQYKESDAAALAFQQAYPRSTLLAPVLFRHAENGFALAEAASKNPEMATKPELWKPLYEEAIRRYGAMLGKFPDFEYAGLARFGQAVSHYKLQQYETAGAALAAIGSSERTGELAVANYMQADCMLRAAPTDVSDAISAGKALQQVTEAIKLLETFVPGNEGRPEGAIATLQIAECYHRIAAIVADPAEKAKALAAALAIYQGFPTTFGATHPLVGQALLGRCNTLAAQGDSTGAMTRLARFQTTEPYPRSPIAPLALTRLAAIMQTQNQYPQSTLLLQSIRQQHEATLLKDPSRAAWVPMIQYQLAMSLRGEGKLPEAVALFDAIAKQFPGASEAADALWRAGQTRYELAKAALAAANLMLAKADAKPDETAASLAAIQAALTQLKETGAYFEAQAAAQKSKGGEPHLRLLYEAAWCHRTAAEAEVAGAIRVKQRESIGRLEPLAKAAAAPNQPPARVYPVDVPASSIPVPNAAHKAIAAYKTIIEAASDAPLAILARFELAEMYAAREGHDAAIALLVEANDLEPEQPLADRVKLRLGASLLGKGDAKAAAEQFAAVTQSKTPELFAEAHLGLAETKIAQNDFPGAIKLLAPFRDKAEFQNIPAVTDRALLRLGHACAYASQWEESRRAAETLFSRFPASPLRFEARYAYALARHQQKNIDDAINQYRDAAKAAAAGQSEIAARAQVSLAALLNEKKQFAEAFAAALPVTYIYDYPDHSAAALVEASRAQLGLMKKDEAKALLERVMKEFPKSEAAKLATQRIAEIK
jgi:TolA-binding protein